MSIFILEIHFSWLYINRLCRTLTRGQKSDWLIFMQTLLCVLREENDIFWFIVTHQLLLGISDWKSKIIWGLIWVLRQLFDTGDYCYLEPDIDKWPVSLDWRHVNLRTREPCAGWAKLRELRRNSGTTALDALPHKTPNWKSKLAKPQIKIVANR